MIDVEKFIFTPDEMAQESGAVCAQYNFEHQYTKAILELSQELLKRIQRPGDKMLTTSNMADSVLDKIIELLKSKGFDVEEFDHTNMGTRRKGERFMKGIRVPEIRTARVVQIGWKLPKEEEDVQTNDKDNPADA